MVALSPKGALRSTAYQSRQYSSRRQAARASAASGKEPATSVDEANERFAIDGKISFGEGRGSLPYAQLRNEENYAADVYLFGANVTSWRQPPGDDVLFVRPDAKFDKSKAISGGVPIIFPQFGSGPMRQHGFARDSDWEVVETRTVQAESGSNDPTIQLRLSSSDETQPLWPQAFEALYEVALLGSTLSLTLTVENKDNKPMSFTTGLHSYIEVTDATSDSVAVTGLKGKSFLDKAENASVPPEKQEENDRITPEESLIDRIYKGCQNGEASLEVGTGAAVVVANRQGFSDFVVWNPDSSVNGWKNFICLENASASQPIELQPGERWVGESQLYIVDL